MVILIQSDNKTVTPIGDDNYMVTDNVGSNVTLLNSAAYSLYSLCCGVPDSLVIDGYCKLYSNIDSSKTKEDAVATLTKLIQSGIIIESDTFC